MLYRLLVNDLLGSVFEWFFVNHGMSWYTVFLLILLNGLGRHDVQESSKCCLATFGWFLFIESSMCSLTTDGRLFFLYSGKCCFATESLLLFILIIVNGLGGLSTQESSECCLLDDWQFFFLLILFNSLGESIVRENIECLLDLDLFGSRFRIFNQDWSFSSNGNLVLNLSWFGRF